APVGNSFTGPLPNSDNAVGTVSWSVVGTLPPGMTLNASTGRITGTPTTPNTYSDLALRAVDVRNVPATTSSFDIVVAPAGLTVAGVGSTTLRAGAALSIASPAVTNNTA